MNKSVNEVVDQLKSMYKKASDIYYGEEVTQLEHALQCYDLAVEAEADATTRVAAFLHDVGHLTDSESLEAFGLVSHDEAGADLLASLGFPPSVAQPVKMHVMAKRYLVAMNPEYTWLLSEASLQTLARQGGPFTAEECLAFQAMPHYEDAIRLRLWDDHGKAVTQLRTEVPDCVYADIRSVLENNQL